MTLLNLEIPAWDSQQKKDRLVGVSLTGWKDMVDILGMSKEEESELRQFLKKVVREEVDSYAETLGINKPLLATTVKPEGTLSQLPTVSSGPHHSTVRTSLGVFVLMPKTRLHKLLCHLDGQYTQKLDKHG